jgi:hypothetical protein
MTALLVLQEAGIGQHARELAQTLAGGRAIMSAGKNEDGHGQLLVRGEAILEKRHEVRGVDLTAMAEPARLFCAVETQQHGRVGKHQRAVDRSPLRPGKLPEPITAIVRHNGGARRVAGNARSQVYGPRALTPVTELERAVPETGDDDHR